MINSLWVYKAKNYSSFSLLGEHGVKKKSWDNFGNSLCLSWDCLSWSIQRLWPWLSSRKFKSFFLLLLEESFFHEGWRQAVVVTSGNLLIPRFSFAKVTSHYCYSCWHQSAFDLFRKVSLSQTFEVSPVGLGCCPVGRGDVTHASSAWCWRAPALCRGMGTASTLLNAALQDSAGERGAFKVY